MSPEEKLKILGEYDRLSADAKVALLQTKGLHEADVNTWRISVLRSLEQRQSSEVSDSDLYNVLAGLVVHSEQVRWTRLNSLLIVNSALMVAWAAVFAGTNTLQYKPEILTALSLPIILLGVLWAFLGDRSNRYLDDFHQVHIMSIIRIS